MTRAKEPDIKTHAYAATILRWPDTPEWLTGCCRNDRPDASECADGHGTTLVVTDAGLLAIGIEPAMAQRIAADQKRAGDTISAKQPIQRAGTKQVMLIALLQAPQGATMDTIMAATGWQSHYADARIMPM